jgi:hypothetical protein
MHETTYTCDMVLVGRPTVRTGMYGISVFSLDGVQLRFTVCLVSTERSGQRGRSSTEGFLPAANLLTAGTQARLLCHRPSGLDLCNLDALVFDFDNLSYRTRSSEPTARICSVVENTSCCFGKILRDLCPLSIRKRPFANSASLCSSFLPFYS